MKVSIARRGGWAAPFNLRRPPAFLDAEALSRAEREELDRLVLAAFAGPAREGDADRRAAGSCTVTIEDGQGRRTLTVADAEAEAEPAAADLCAWIEARLPR